VLKFSSDKFVLFGTFLYLIYGTALEHSTRHVFTSPKIYARLFAQSLNSSEGSPPLTLSPFCFVPSGLFLFFYFMIIIMTRTSTDNTCTRGVPLSANRTNLFSRRVNKLQGVLPASSLTLQTYRIKPYNIKCAILSHTHAAGSFCCTRIN